MTKHSSFNRCQVWTVDATSLCDCAAMSTSENQLPGLLWSVGSYWTAWIRQPAGKGLEWIGSGRTGYTTHYKDSLKNKFSIEFDTSSKTVTLKGTERAAWRHCCVLLCQRHTMIQTISRPETKTPQCLNTSSMKPPEEEPKDYWWFQTSSLLL